MFRRLNCLTVLLLLAAPATALAAPSKEYLELQRQIAQLRELIVNHQRALDQKLQSQNDKIAALQSLVQQSIDAANAAGKSVTAVQNNVQQKLKDWGDDMLPRVVKLSTSMDSLTGDFQNIQESSEGLTGLNDKIMTRLASMEAAMKVLMSAPASPPAPAGVANEPVRLSATDMLAAAGGDRNAGHFGLALEGYANFVKTYGDSADAPEALYYIGEIHFRQQEFETAANDFAAVAGKSSATNRWVRLALLYRVRSLVKLNRRDDAAAEFRDLVTQYPNDREVKSACDEFKSLGVSCATPRTPPRTPARKK